MSEKLSHLEFTIRAIDNLRKHPYKGIHCVYSGFNNAFREYFEEDPVPVINGLVSSDSIQIKSVKGGVMIYKAGEKPKDQDPKETVRRILN